MDDSQIVAQEACDYLTVPAVRSLLEAIPAALYITDNDGRITHYNATAVDMWGRRPEPGEMWCGSWKILNEDGSIMPHDQCPMALTVRSGEPTVGWQLTVERPDGRRALVAPHPWPIRDEQGQMIGVVNLLVDVTKPKAIEVALLEAESDAKKLSRELNQQRRITQLLAEGETLHEVAEPLLRILCDLGSAQVGCLWLLDGRATMRCVATFSSIRASYLEFLDQCHSTTIKLDENLPGKVVMDRQPIWARSLATSKGFRRRRTAQDAGLNSAVVCPVMLRDDLPVRAAIELFFSEARARDERLLKAIAEAALKLGTFLDRLEVESAAREDQRRLMVEV